MKHCKTPEDPTPIGFMLELVLPPPPPPPHQPLSLQATAADEQQCLGSIRFRLPDNRLAELSIGIIVFGVQGEV
jgi:hypothetical protein